jgi:hypothetical protein
MADGQVRQVADQRVRFGRDLLINVLGNLATAAILYLVAAAAGFVRKDPALLIGAGLGLLAFVAWYVPIWIGSRAQSMQPDRRRMVSVVLIAMLSALLVALAFAIWVIASDGPTIQS